MLTVSLAPIVGHDPGGVFEVPAGKTLYVPLTGADPGHAVSYTAQSNNTNVHLAVLDGNPTLVLNVHGTRADGMLFAGELHIELFEDLAPTTVQAISNLVNAGAYNGKSFYRVVPDFVIQGGLQSSGAPFFADEFDPDLTFNSPGLFAMANPGTPDSNTSEFFLTDIDLPYEKQPQYLNFRHTIFGQLTSGFETFQNIMNAKGITGSNSTPNPPVIIDSASLVNDDQSAVLQITAPNDFDAMAIISVTAHSSDGSTAFQAFRVDIAPAVVATDYQPIIINPITDQTTHVGTPISFEVSSQVYHGVTLSPYSISGVGGFRRISDLVSVQIIPGSENTSTITLTPLAGFYGTVELVLHADDPIDDVHDVQKFALHVTTTDLAISTVTDPINNTNVENGLITGTGAVLGTISIYVTDGIHSTSTVTTTVGYDGTWAMGGLDLSALDDGTITFVVKIRDRQGNSEQVTRSVVKNVVQSNVAILSVTNPIDDSNQRNTFIAGVGKPGDIILVVADDGANSTSPQITTVADDGSWSIGGIDVSGLRDGTIVYQVTAIDGLGNRSQADIGTNKNTSILTVAINEVADFISHANVNNVSIRGIGQIGATVSVVVTDGLTSTAPKSTTVDGNGEWTLDGVDVHALNDGSINFIATIEDANGHTAQTTATSIKDTANPALTIDSATNPINASNAFNVQVTGFGEPDAQLSIFATDGVNSTSPYATSVTGNGFWGVGLNIGALNDGPITFVVISYDAVGNSTQQSIVITKDTVAPTLTLASFTNPIFSSSSVNLSASGTGEPGAVVRVRVSDAVYATAPVTTVVDAGGHWSVAGIDGRLLRDTIVIYTVTAVDAVGNQSLVTNTAFHSGGEGSLSGYVYVDFNNNLTRDRSSAQAPDSINASPDFGLRGVKLTLQGIDFAGNPLPTRTTTTGSDGSYQFVNLPTGRYTVRESQPSKLKSAVSNIGNLGGSARTNVISRIVIIDGGASAAMGYNFGERPLKSTPPSKSLYNKIIAAEGTDAPAVTSISRHDADPTAANQVRFRIKFDQAVTGVGKSDFALLTIGSISGASIAKITGSGKTYTVTVNTGSGSGTLGLMLVDDDSITNRKHKKLGGEGNANGNFVSEYYSVIKNPSSDGGSITVNGGGNTTSGGGSITIVGGTLNPSQFFTDVTQATLSKIAPLPSTAVDDFFALSADAG